MADDPAQSRTEAATPRRREEARRKGQVAYSADLSTSAIVLLGLVVLWFIGPTVGAGLMRMMRSELSRGAAAHWQPADVRVFLVSMVGHAAAATAGVVVASLAAALLIGVSQAGLRITFQPLSPNWERLNPASGWGRLLSMKSAVRAAMAAGKATLVVAAVWWVVASEADGWLVHDTLMGAVASTWSSGIKVAMIATAALLALAAADYLYQRQKHESDLRMTRQELIEERRSDEVDPQLRARMRRLLREAAQHRALADVPAATVVVSNPTHFAVALRYERGQDTAPTVLAKGTDRWARRIIERAEEHGVPVLRRPPVARALFALGEVGAPIPEPLFHAVAEIVAFVYAQRRQRS